MHFNVNKIDIVMYFSELLCQFLLICFQREVNMSKLSAKSQVFVKLKQINLGFAGYIFLTVTLVMVKIGQSYSNI